ncbi:MAG: hypothetical protein ABIQ16_05655 [Polyangiaceae bacterium]
MKRRKLAQAELDRQGLDGTPMRGQVFGQPAHRIPRWSIAGGVLERGHILRDEALLIWDKIVGECPHFFDTYPRDEARTGPFTDEEKVEIISEITLHELRMALS